VGAGATTVAAALVAAAAFAGYATGSVGVVTGAVDDVLVRSEKPKPKPWERGENRDSGSTTSFRARVAGERGTTGSTPSSGSGFERVRRERIAAEAARDAELRDQLAQKPGERATGSSGDAFQQRVEADGAQGVKAKATEFRSRVRGKRAKHGKSTKRPFEKRVEGSGG
jgi:hypothetical protein